MTWCCIIMGAIAIIEFVGLAAISLAYLHALHCMDEAIARASRTAVELDCAVKKIRGEL